jgi:phage head maturation protease
MARTKLGWTSGLRAADDGLYGTIAVRPNARADVKAMIADGIKELSIGFQPAAGGTMTRADGSRLRVKGALDHIALEPQGAYPGAEVLAMRAQALAKEDEAFVAEAERADRVDLEAWLKEAEETQLMYARRAHGITG